MAVALSLTGMLAGGLGLLLIGMSLMTDGLKVAAGSALRDILATWTRSPIRGLWSGILITALVQSSSAVTIAAIGFVNASLLNLQQAVWVIFGSNVGTTMTGWIVALVGFKVDVEAFALPIIGAGIVLKLTGEHSRRGSLGQSLIGFGLLFLGIGVLKETFEGFGAQLSLPALQGSGVGTIGAYVLVGVLLTTLMQSSSAALVIAFSAAEGQLVSLQAAAALVVGANLGTTTTALMSVWEATPPAKRVAVSHVLFNVVTACVALIILVPLLGIVGWIQRLLALTQSPATTLAIFHTVFNALGVLLMWPLASRLVDFLSHRFQSLEEVESRPKFLDRTSLNLPFIAGEALASEVARIRGYAARAAQTVATDSSVDTAFVADVEEVARSLAGAVAAYSVELSRTRLPDTVSDVLPDLLRSAQQSGVVIDLVRQALVERAQIGEFRNEALVARLREFRERLAAVIDAADQALVQTDTMLLAKSVEQLDEAYDELKQTALRAGVSGQVSVVSMDALIQHASLSRRAVKQLARSTARLSKARAALGDGTHKGSVQPAAVRDESSDAYTADPPGADPVSDAAATDDRTVETITEDESRLRSGAPGSL